MLAKFFSSESVFIPQSFSQFYKFKVGEQILINIPPQTRKSVYFKYSLNPG
jgi:hypothetical protein